MKKPLIEQWLEDYWDLYVSDEGQYDRSQIDQIVYKLINRILIEGDDQLHDLRDRPIISPVTGKPLINYQPVRLNRYFIPNKIMKHEQMVNSVAFAIKPGYCSVMCQKFTREQIVNYLLKVKSKNVSDDPSIKVQNKFVEQKILIDPKKEIDIEKVKPIDKDEFGEESSMDQLNHDDKEDVPVPTKK